MYIRNVHLTTSVNFVFAGYKESYCVLEYNICLYYCELLLE